MEELKLQLSYIHKKDWRNKEDKLFLVSPEWKSIRIKVLERDNYSCRYCGYYAKKFQIVHHIDHEKGNNQIENLATACQMCNLILHAGLGCVIQGVVDLYKKSKYKQNEISKITRLMRNQGKSDKDIIKYLGLKDKVEFEEKPDYLLNLFGFVTDRKPLLHKWDKDKQSTPNNLNK